MIIRVVAGTAVLAKLVDIVPMLQTLADPTSLRAPVLGLIPYPGPIAVWLTTALAASAAVLLILNVADRAAAGALALGVAALILLDAQLYANHLYLLGLVLLVWALAPSDARGPSYRWLVTTVYGFAAVAKLNITYLSGLVLAGNVGTGWLPVPEPFQVWWLMTALATLSVLIEAFLAVGLWLPRWRRDALVAGVILHCSILVFMGPWLELLIFGAIMISLYTAFRDTEPLLQRSSPIVPHGVSRSTRLSSSPASSSLEDPIHTQSRLCGRGPRWDGGASRDLPQLR